MTQTIDRTNGRTLDVPATPTVVPPGTASKPTVVELILRVMDSVQAVRKGDRNTEQNYIFRGIDAVVNAVGPELRRHGVLTVPLLDKATYRDVTTSRGKPSRECTVEVTYRFYGPAGDYIDAKVPGESMDFGDKGTAKAMSVAYRILLLQTLCIPTDEPDPDAQTYEREQQPADWDNAQPGREQATAEQKALFDEYAKRVAAAENKEKLPAIWEEAKAAFGEGKLIAQHGNVLRAAVADKDRELSGSPI